MAQHRRSSTRHRMVRSAGYVSAGFALALGVSGCGADLGGTPASSSVPSTIAPAGSTTTAPAGSTTTATTTPAPAVATAAATAGAPATAPTRAPAPRVHVAPRRPAVVTPKPRVVPRPHPAPPAATGARAGTYTNSRGQQIERPDANAAGATAVCKDGTDSHSASRSGTCSRHGGVARWL